MFYSIWAHLESFLLTLDLSRISVTFSHSKSIKNKNHKLSTSILQCELREGSKTRETHMNPMPVGIETCTRKEQINI